MNHGAIPKRTALFDIHQAHGAHMTQFAGWTMPLWYVSDLAEHLAVRSGAGLFDLSHMGEMGVAGPEAARFLDYALVSRISAMSVGDAKYTMMCSSDGGVIDDLIVYRMGQFHFLVVANAANAPVVAADLSERARGFEVALRDDSDSWALIAVQGPAALAVLRPLSHDHLDRLRYYSISRAVIADVPVWIARTGYTGEDGFELFAAPADAPVLWQRVLCAGSDLGVVPAGLACRDSLRLEAGMPLYGNELSLSQTPYEAGLGRVVALDKPDDFVGKAALERASRCHVSRIRVGLAMDGRRAARAGYLVIPAGGGDAVGVVTSGALSPTLGHPIAMAYVDLDRSEPGTNLVIDVRGALISARVVPLPFYTRAEWQTGD